MEFLYKIFYTGNSFFFFWQPADVREYWIVDPEKEIITVYSFEKETMEQYSFCEDVLVRIYAGFFIKVQ